RDDLVRYHPVRVLSFCHGLSVAALQRHRVRLPYRATKGAARHHRGIEPRLEPGSGFIEGPGTYRAPGHTHGYAAPNRRPMAADGLGHRFFHAGDGPSERNHGGFARAVGCVGRTKGMCSQRRSVSNGPPSPCQQFNHKNGATGGMRASSPKTPTRRLYILAALLCLWIFAICFRLVRLQVVKYGFFVQLAHRQQNRTIPVEPRRGNIFDRYGHPLAMSIDVDSVFAVPSEVHDPESTAAVLGKVLNLDPQEIVAHIESSRNFAYISRKVDAETSDRIRELNLRGIYFRKEPKRFYPDRELAAQVLGYVGMDDEGLGGLERVFDDDLRGIPGKEMISIDARRKWFGRVDKPPDPGQNLVLTIDQTIQYIAERELQRGMEDTKAIAGTVIVQNPRTGEILALANRPTFNPNVFNNVPQE